MSGCGVERVQGALPSRLRVLDLSHNPLSAVPPLPAHVTHVHLCGCALRDLPASAFFPGRSLVPQP